MHIGKFITIEGTEGAGKSTSIAYIKAQLESQGIDLICTREPGGTPLAETIRGLLLSHSQEKIDAYTELLLMFAARRQHVQQVIQPALQKGTWVLCDRFTDATFAYQGYGRELSLDFIEGLAKGVHQDCNPDYTLLLDINVVLGMQRVKARADGYIDRIEAEQQQFFERVREGYLQRAQLDPQRFVVVDASVDLAGVEKQLAVAIQGML